jgi:hypothetical protein
MQVFIGLLSRDPQAQSTYFFPATCALLGIAVVLAPCMQSVLMVASLLGAATGTIMCFVVPGAILLRHKSRRTRSHALQRSVAQLQRCAHLHRAVVPCVMALRQ